MSRRALLRRALAGATALALLPLLGAARAAGAQAVDEPAAPPSGPALAEPAAAPVRVRVATLVQQGRADFATGQADGVALPRTGGERGLSAGQAGGTFTSGVLETAFEASHVGLHWQHDGGEGLRFELRASRDGARWSRWQAVLLEAGKDDTPRDETFGALVGARGTRFLQYRVSFPAGRESLELRRVALTYLDARPRQPGARAGLVSSLFGLADFRDQVVSREAWGADESLRADDQQREVWPRAYVPVKKVVVHHTAGANDYSDGAAEVRAIYTYHAETLGWGDIGYHLLIDSTGQVYEGRRGRDDDPDGRYSRDLVSRDVVAGHATGFNYGTAGVALLGNFVETPLPPLMRERLEDALVYLCWRAGVDPLGRSDYLLQSDLWRDGLADLPGHRDCTPTECPGDQVYMLLPAIRRAVARRLADDGPRPGPVRLRQGREAWPGQLDFSWRGSAREQYSTLLEGWYRLPGHDEIVELSGYQAGTSLPAWSAWSSATSLSVRVPPAAHGHYTLHLRARTAPGVDGTTWSRATALVEPQLAVDNTGTARGRARALGPWQRADQPRQFFGRDFAYSPPGQGERSFRWRLTAPIGGRYAVQACWPHLDDAASAVPYRLLVGGRQVATASADQTANPAAWATLAELDLEAGQSLEVQLLGLPDATVAADAVRLLLV